MNREAVIQRLAANTKLVGDCWIWTGPTRRGWARISVDNRTRFAHRLSYEIHVGPVPESLCVAHRCGTRLCVNPEHLEPAPRGTPWVVRFWSKVNKTETCWLWTGAEGVRGYGNLYVNGKFRAAHRLAYELLVGPIPEQLHLDHLCRIRMCVNPDHLEPVTPHENVMRGMSPAAIAVRENKCQRGHEFTPENTIRVGTQGRRRRQCRTCENARQRKQYAASRQGVAVKGGAR